jgi:hypothetical protein
MDGRLEAQATCALSETPGETFVHFSSHNVPICPERAQASPFPPHGFVGWVRPADQCTHLKLADGSNIELRNIGKSTQVNNLKRYSHRINNKMEAL